MTNHQFAELVGGFGLLVHDLVSNQYSEEQEDLIYAAYLSFQGELKRIAETAK